MKLNREKYGFTIIEILIVIGILAILFAITLIAVNPTRQFQAASDTKRKSDISEIKSSLMQYYVDRHTFPNDSQWAALTCGATTAIPTPFNVYMSQLPCDPDAGVQKYYYHPLDATCQPCDESSANCPGFRILGKLKNPQDKAITNSGCDPVMGCGVVESDGVVPNYGISSGECSVYATPVPATPTPVVSDTPTPSWSPTPDPSGSPTSTITLTPTPSSTPTQTPTPSITLTPSPTPTSSFTITPIPGYTPNASYDITRVSRLLTIALGLEKFKFLYGAYPTCGNTWQNVSCLSVSLSIYMPTGSIPSDPENGEPFIYIANGLDGYCLGAHLANPSSVTPAINCPVAAPLSLYQYRFRERGEIIYRPTPSGLTEPQKAAYDAQRIADIANFKSAMQAYRNANGHYPNCWSTANTWASTGSGSFFCGGQLNSYGSNFNFDPGGANSYNIVQWDPDANGYFQQYCYGASMDVGNNTNCSLSCPVQNYNANYCYFVKNP